MIHSKKQLAVTLSRLQGFERPSARLEQYPTDSEIAAEVIWSAYQNNDIESRVIADLGCGTGILGIGTMFFNPQKVYFLDIDERQLKSLDTNLKLQELKVPHEILHMDVTGFSAKTDVVIQNPPFGIKNAHADRKFLEAAFRCAQVIYSFHMLESENFINKFSQDNKFRVTQVFRFRFPLKNSMDFHNSRIKRIDVGCWRMEKIGLKIANKNLYIP